MVRPDAIPALRHIFPRQTARYDQSGQLNPVIVRGACAGLLSPPLTKCRFYNGNYSKIQLYLAKLAVIALCLLASPAFAGPCVGLAADTFAKLNWGTAERYEGITATRLMQAMMATGNEAGRLTDLQIYNVPPVDAIYAFPAGDQVLIIRVKGTLMCPDDPVGRATFEDAKRWVLPASA